MLLKYINGNYYVLLESTHTNPSISGTFEMHPESVSLLGCLVPPAFPLEFAHLYQIFTPSTSFLSWGRERSCMEPVATFERKFGSS
jgi:hypothetical protein